MEVDISDELPNFNINIFHEREDTEERRRFRNQKLR